MPGPPGPSGEGADGHYLHQQLSPSTVWTIDHNLLKRPAIQVFDSAGDECEGLVVHVSLTRARIEFSAAFSGFATCN